MRRGSRIVAGLTLLALASAAKANEDDRVDADTRSMDPITATVIEGAGERGTMGGAGRMSRSNTFQPVVLVPVEAPIEPVDRPQRPEPASAPVEPPPIVQEPQVLFIDGPCPPGYDRVSVDAVGADGRFTAGFSYCERRVPERSNPSHEGGPRDDHTRPPEP